MRLIPICREFRMRWRRHATAVIGLALGICLLLVIQAMSAGYGEAARIPMRDIGADISIQRNGDVPENLDGVVFPCSAVTLRQEEMEAVGGMDGVRALARAVLLWVFQDGKFAMVLGIEPESPHGPGSLRRYVVRGAFLDGAEPGAVLDESYAHDAGLDVGDSVTVAGRTYPVVGLVSASRAPGATPAHIYLPIGEARAMAVASAGVQAVSPFASGDANVLFLVADQEKIPDLTASLRRLLGDRTSIATPETFLKRLGAMLALSDRFSAAIGLTVFGAVLLLTIRTAAGSVRERAGEMAVLRCIGWTRGNLLGQFAAETLAQCLLAAAAGIILAAAVCFLLSFQTLDIPIPWEMSPTPHFLPGGSDPVFRTVRLPVELSPAGVGTALALSLGTGVAVTLICAGRLTGIRPSEVLRHE